MTLIQRKIPLRMCLGCLILKPKKEMVRIVKSKENVISIDLIGKMQGRGAYICRCISCFNKARKSKKIERTFESTISEEIYEQLQLQLEEANGK